MSDGAHQGIGAERALGTILGGEPEPAEDEGMSRDQMEAAIMAASDDPDSYDAATMRTARFILTTLRAHPEILAAPVEDEYDFSGIDMTGEVRIPEGGIPLRVKGWPALLKEADPEGYRRAVADITGFMWGYAVNAARYVLDEPPAPNPAIATVG